MKVLIAEDHGVVRQGLRALIEEEQDIEVVGEAEDGLEVMELAEQSLPDVILMDITMPNLNGVEATRFILENHPNIRIIALSVHFDKHFVMEMLRAGASGYVLKSYLFDEVLRALKTVAAGQHYLSPKITEVVLDDYIPLISKTEKSSKEHLTARERQVVQLLAEGKSTKQIARQLHVSPKTVDSNRRQVMKKLGISSVAELTKYAIREGLTSAEF
ncbi:MAG: response regulator transcription factor [Sedimentisphaerales bacterium]|nr:response regulator transcription factor [Sedimentisphaerales bacterium]